MTNILLATSLFLIGISIGKYTFPVSFILAFGIFMVVDRESLNKYVILDGCLFLLILFLCIFCCGKLCGVDYDGNTYHKMAVGLLKNGWNPIKMSAAEFFQQLFPESVLGSQALWCDHYGKASWIFAASIYAITGNIECGKAYNILAMICLFCFMYSYLENRQYPLGKRGMISLAVTLNPVSVAQVSTYYIDGFLFSLFFVLAIALTEDIDPSNLNYGIKAKTAVMSAFVVCGNIKFTGLLYGVVFGFAYLIFYTIDMIINQKKQWGLLFGKQCLVYGIFSLITVVWAGAPTYIQNFLQHGSFTYPLTGQGSVDIMTGNSPAGFVGLPGAVRLFYSLFSEMQNLSYYSADLLPRLKFPFTVKTHELTAFRYVTLDMRISGFGVFFSGILIISLIIIVCAMWKLWKEREMFWLSYFGMNIGVILLLSFGISESWWARYSPYMYMPVIFALIFLLESKENSVIKKISAFMFVLLLLNNTMFLGNTALAFNNYVQFKGAMERINRQTDPKVFVIEGDFSGLVFNLEDWIEEYTVVTEKDGFETDAVYYDGMLEVRL